MSTKKPQPATWNPLDSVNRTVDRLIEDPPAKKSVGRPKVVGRQRIVLYLEEQQAQNLKIAAIKQKTDASAIVRRVLKEAGF
jgi:hypothetical protein